MKLLLEIDDNFTKGKFESSQQLKDMLWEEICNILESGDNFRLTEMNLGGK